MSHKRCNKSPYHNILHKIKQRETKKRRKWVREEYTTYTNKNINTTKFVILYKVREGNKNTYLKQRHEVCGVYST